MKPEQEPEPFVIDYATAALNAVSRVTLMRRWRAICGWSFMTAMLGMGIYVPIGLGAAATAIVAAIFAITHMGQLAKAEAGAGYAARQVVLAILLSFFFLFGVWLVPILVESDLSKWRTIEGNEGKLP